MSKSKTAKSHVPEGTQAITPQLVVKGARAFADKLVEVFGAEKLAEYPNADGSVMFAVVKIGDSKLFLSDAGGFAQATKGNVFVYVPDVDAAVGKLAACGGKVLAPPSDMFWGDRWALVEDPSGNQWQIATHLQDLSVEEVRSRMASAAAPPAE
ncbi:MAG: VOC family protein [Myxococcales bacterium]|nr:VOC family protein [Myxococcales bacterium]